MFYNKRRRLVRQSDLFDLSKIVLTVFPNYLNYFNNRARVALLL